MILQSAYFNALYRYAFKYSNEDGDVISTVANDLYSFPTTNELVSAAGNRIYDVPFALVTEYLALIYSLDGEKTRQGIEKSILDVDLHRVRFEIDSFEEHLFFHSLMDWEKILEFSCEKTGFATISFAAYVSQSINEDTLKPYYYMEQTEGDGIPEIVIESTDDEATGSDKMDKIMHDLTSSGYECL